MTGHEPADITHRPSVSPPISSGASSSSESDFPQPTSPRPASRRTRMERPRLGDRQRSNTIIVPKGRDVVQRERPEYPPDDARAMSPRRNSEDIERIERGLRETLKEQARNLQSSLAALAEKIDEVKNDHDKLETENRFLQDYIGGLTRTMSRDNLGRSASTSSKKKGKR
ncbi:uncharacterized protein Z519_10919 [Cladophialophora bantiana CBS 173.52]|uniref:BZIP transcription factor n=1 Tax=Cladophialophora bantiana (strain ATCC 10958 / CBS 173.52 / CDC B-1940 / NIH 8579) TaxID=1442370 RepID=A0A0D2EDY8_CLAB1|nr:uncharacterized protein Z519_10919 [Cladophialophora bantiana CBS 173.52]KIW88351.1 hypothetical protein Z519_10919 [Cladophialophora bantiana CBS 173.52]